MSALAKAITVVLIFGLVCCGFAGNLFAGALEDNEAPGIPLYYLQLRDFTASLEERAHRPKIMEYTVQPGDCLYTIARECGTDVETLVYLNGIARPDLIHPGDRLEILTVVGCVHDVEEGDTVTAIARAYGVKEGAILQANEIEAPASLHRGERIIVPGGVFSRAPGRPSFRWPLEGVLTSGFGWRKGKFHYGIDIAAAYGTAFRAAAGGRVTCAGYRGGYGIMIEVDHGAGYRTRYGHACSSAVAAGQQVSPGQILGYIGLTGNTTGPHLHFEIYEGDQKVDPLGFLE